MPVPLICGELVSIFPNLYFWKNEIHPLIWKLSEIVIYRDFSTSLSSIFRREHFKHVIPNVIFCLFYITILDTTKYREFDSVNQIAYDVNIYK